MDSLARQLRLVYPHVIVRPSIGFPRNSYVAGRHRYRADSLIAFLRQRTPAGHVTLAVTGRDISTTKGKTADWGVMGLGYRPGNACITSTFRLSKKRREERFYKVCLHELGHTQGLARCPTPTCFMRDAEGGNPLDEENDFCSSYRATLKNSGWQLR